GSSTTEQPPPPYHPSLNSPQSVPYLGIVQPPSVIFGVKGTEGVMQFIPLIGRSEWARVSRFPVVDILEHYFKCPCFGAVALFPCVQEVDEGLIGTVTLGRDILSSLARVRGAGPNERMADKIGPGLKTAKLGHIGLLGAPGNEVRLEYGEGRRYQPWA